MDYDIAELEAYQHNLNRKALRMIAITMAVIVGTGYAMIKYYAS